MLVDFDTIEEEEQTRNAVAEEERRKYEEATQLQRVMDLEAEAEARLQRQDSEPAEGTTGATITIELRESKRTRTNMFFCDAMNQALKVLHKLFADHKRVNEACAAGYEGRIDAIAAFLNCIVPKHFRPTAAAYCEKLANLFQGEKSLCVLVQEWLADDTSKRSRGETKKSVDTVLRHSLACLRKLGRCTVAPCPEFPPFYGALVRAVFPDAPPPLVDRWFDQGSDLEPLDEVDMVLRTSSPDDARTVVMSKSATVQELRELLTALLGRSDIELFGVQSSGNMVPLSQGARMQFLGQVVVVRGVEAWPPSSEEPAPGDADEDSPPEWVTMWRHQANRICKTTHITATRLLCELRSRFVEDQFLRKYKALKKDAKPGNKAHTDLLALTFAVQSVILPRYGFEATPKGLQEMRDEMPVFAGWNVWEFHDHGTHDEVVWKIRRDIHAVLDMGQSLPRLKLGGGFVSWWTFARLQANVESGCIRAAQKIMESDVLLLCTGAGFSADSGLAVYADVAKVPAYATRGLEYNQICEPRWLRKEPGLFWGFWGQCHNDYRDTAPHRGYQIIDRWADRRFRGSDIGQAVRAKLVAKAPSLEAGAAMSPLRQPYAVEEYAGGFFVFTSNVDAHSYDWFHACEVRECHGSTELYQCASSQGRCEPIWRAPFDFRFSVDRGTMLAPKCSAVDPSAFDECGPDVAAPEEDPGAAPRIGHVRGGGRPDALRHMPPPPTEMELAAEAGFRSNHPVCPFCNAPARPAILMFKDSEFRDVPSQKARWDAWVAAVQEVIADNSGAGVQVAILEIGAGGNVTTVRETSEKHVRLFEAAGADVQLIRVNPELPLGDSECFAPGGESEHQVISIMGCALECLQKMDAAMSAAMR